MLQLAHSLVQTAPAFVFAFRSDYNAVRRCSFCSMNLYKLSSQHLFKLSNSILISFSNCSLVMCSPMYFASCFFLCPLITFFPYHLRHPFLVDFFANFHMFDIPDSDNIPLNLSQATEKLGCSSRD